MRVEIEYSAEEGCQTRAEQVRLMIVDRTPGADVALRRSDGEAFEITVDGALVYSRKATGRFPTETEILAAIT